MTVATSSPNLPVPVSGDAQGLTVLHDWVAAADDAAALARQLVQSFFVPMAYKPQGPNGTEVAVANATGAILLGQSLGLDPLTSLQQIYVVHGRPGMYSKMKVALAQREGHRIWEEEYTPERSTWAGQRKGSDDVVRITLTIEDAKRAGWTSNAAYAKTPADMLSARASARVVDRIAADALFGLRSIEDLDDEPEPAPTVTRVSVDDITAAAPQAITVSVSGKVASGEDLAEALRRSVTRETPTASPAAASPAARAPQEPEVAAEVGPAATSTDVPMCTDAQYRRINAWFKASGIDHVNGEGQAAARTRVVNMLVADPPTRPLIAKWSEMTEAEAKLVIDTLDANGFAIVAEAFEPAEQQPAEASSDVANHEQADAEPDLEPDADDPWRGQGGE